MIVRLRRIILRGLLVASIGTRLAAAEPASSPALTVLLSALAKTEDPRAQLNILRGINAAMKGQRGVAAPPTWAAIYTTLQKSPNEELRQQAQALAATFGGTAALDELRKVLATRDAAFDRRRAALDSLIAAKDAQTLPLLLSEVESAAPLRAPALKALGSYEDAAIPKAILAAYPKLSSEERRDALATLTMRPAWAHDLLEAVDRKTLARTDITAPLARQLQDLKDSTVDQWLGKNWGAVHTSTAEKQKEIARFKAFLTPASLQKADPSHGRAIFTQTCAICHTIFGSGAKIGPELPGAFEDVDYLLQNVLDPNAIIGKDYQQTVVQLKDGQTLIGIVGGEDGATLTLKSLAGPVTLQRSDITSLKMLDVSLMPEGLLNARTEDEVRDLFAYLGRHGQVPMLAGEMNVNDFFNGSDLARWIPSSSAKWNVQEGAIVGQGSADRAEFLTSDLVFGDATFSCELKWSGPNAVAEIMVRGEVVEGEFVGAALLLRKGNIDLVKYRRGGETVRVSSHALPPDSQSVKYEVGIEGPNAKVKLNGESAFDLIEATPLRTTPSFRIRGEGAELRIKDPAVVLPK